MHPSRHTPARLLAHLRPLSLLGLLALSTAQAQISGYDDPEDRLQRQRSQAQNQQLQKTPDITGTPTVRSNQRLLDNETPCFPLQQIHIQETPGLATAPAPTDPQTTPNPPSPLYAIVSDALSGPDNNDHPLGKCLGAQSINILLQRAQETLVAQGYVTSRVLAPPQNLANGTLTLTLLPGRIHTIRFAPDTPGAPGSNTRGPINLTTNLPMAEGDLLNLRPIEQTLENLKRPPQADADIQIEPSASGAPDHSDLVIRYQSAPPARATLTLDDSGSRNTGPYQASATLSLDNPLGLSDLLYITLNHDLTRELGHSTTHAPEGPRGTQGHTIHYSAPFGYWLVSATQTTNSYYQSIAGAAQNYTYSGDSETAELSLARILQRDARSKTSATLKAWSRASRNYIDDTEIEVQRRTNGGWELGLAHKTTQGDTTLDTRVAYKRGTDDFGAAPAPEEYEQTNPDTGRSKLGILSLETTYTQQFQALPSPQPFTYSATLRLQDNTTPLTAADRFAIGGRYTVRGFDGESSLSGERGWLLRNDLSTPLGASSHKLYLGLDAGEVSGPSTAEQLGNTLSGGVVGLRGALQSGADLQYDLFVGAPLSQPNGFKTARTTAGFSLTLSF